VLHISLTRGHAKGHGLSESFMFLVLQCWHDSKGGIFAELSKPNSR
jgi:hypothetical protein